MGKPLASGCDLLVAGLPAQALASQCGSPPSWSAGPSGMRVGKEQNGLSGICGWRWERGVLVSLVQPGEEGFWFIQPSMGKRVLVSVALGWREEKR